MSPKKPGVDPEEPRERDAASSADGVCEAGNGDWGYYQKEPVSDGAKVPEGLQVSSAVGETVRGTKID